MRRLTELAIVYGLLCAALAHAQTVQSIQLAANHILYEPVSGKIYASVPSSAGSNGNSIATIDPTTASVVRTVFIGSEPGALAASDDGQFLYVGLDGADAVRRYTLATHKAGLQFGLGSNVFGFYYAGDMKVLPGQPHALAVSRDLLGAHPTNDGIGVFDDGVLRPNVLKGFQVLTDVLAFSASPSILYAQDTEEYGTLSTLAIDSNGVTLSSSVPYLWAENSGPLVFDASTDRLFETSGWAIDPQVAALTGTFSQTRQTYNYAGSGSGIVSGIVADTANDRVFFLIYDQFSQGSSVTIASFDPTTFMPIGSLVVPNVVTAGNLQSVASDLVSWGTDGLAFRTTDGQVWIIRGRSFPALASFRLSAAKVVGGAALTGTVTLSRPAPSVGATITLSSTPFGLANPPASVTVPAGKTSATFAIATVAGNEDVTLTAAYGAQSINRSLQVVSSASASVYPANVRVFHLLTNDLVFDPFSELIYASVPSSVVGIGNSLTAISPSKATLGASVFIGSEPYRLAISDDGQFTYAGLNGAASIRRYDSATQTAELQYSLGIDSFGGCLYFPGQLVVLPGEPHALVVSRLLIGRSPAFAGMPIYDDDVARPNAYFGPSMAYSIAPGATAGRLYGYDNESSPSGFARLNVDSSGVTLLDNTNNLISGFGAVIAYQGGMIFASNGQVIDPEARKLVGTFTGLNYGAMAPDLADGKVYFVDWNYSGESMLRLFDSTTFQEIADFLVPGAQYPSSVLRWKADQVAFRTFTGLVFLVNAALPTLTTLTITPSAVVGGASATGTVRLSNVATVGGVVVSLVCANPSVVSAPSSVTVPAGLQSVSFGIQTSSVSAAAKVRVSATYKSITKSVAITVKP